MTYDQRRACAEPPANVECRKTCGLCSEPTTGQPTKPSHDTKHPTAPRNHTKRPTRHPTTKRPTAPPKKLCIPKPNAPGCVAKYYEGHFSKALCGGTFLNPLTADDDVLNHVIDQFEENESGKTLLACFQVLQRGFCQAYRITALKYDVKPTQRQIQTVACRKCNLAICRPGTR